MSHFRPTSARVRYHVLLYAIVRLPSLLAGCGGDDDDSGSDYKLRTTAFKSNAIREPGESGTVKVRACTSCSPAFVARAAAKSHALSNRPTTRSTSASASGTAAGRHLKLIVDSAPQAQLRYYNLLAEQHEYHNADPELKARQIKGVGEDSAYGGAGAWWTRGRNQLVVYDHDKILKVRVERRRLERPPSARRGVALAQRAVREDCAPSAPAPVGPHHDLVHAHVRRARDGVQDLSRDVLGLEHLADLLARPLRRAAHDRVGVVALELGLDETRRHGRHADPTWSASWRSASENACTPNLVML